MGHNVTEGAIVQHLAKLRARRAATGKDVPPPLRRGGVGAAIKPSKPTTTGSKRKAHKSPSGSDDESSIHFECDDASSDEEYTEKRRSKRKPKMAKRRGSTPIKVESDSEQDKREEVSASSEELLVPGASFLDFPNSNVSDDSSVESSPSPVERSKIVVLKYRRQTEENQESLFGGEEEEVALPPAEAGGADLDVIGNNRSEPGFNFNVDQPLVNPEINPEVDPDYLLFQPFENMPEGSYITHDGITYEPTPLQNGSELPTGLMGEGYFLNDPTFSYQDLLETDGNLNFY
ncbi:uncharacterized protein LDX57_011782 [Aspergillus melleus]|uniref:uncharacterized protein n=1 Tax=Aspergillus melleus TaxID=138277 RepID=UPI001E8E104C|nr:uncharacterized protein LDX57_011782 [Aspergillus melleus]KAH8434144.1 hypothetical protein LDX57_011782 [Aspergillus melleus]